MADRLYFEDFKPGTAIELGSRTVSGDEVIRFATAFDPQPFHIDEEAAKTYPYGGLIASGWHTASLLMRMMVDTVLSRGASMGSPGVDELRWLKPMRPGDTLTGIMRIDDCTPSRSKPDRGIVTVTCEMRNQLGELILSKRSKNFYQRRRPGAAA